MPFRRTSIDSNQRTGFYAPKRSRVVGSRRIFEFDSNALTYINAVEAADGQALEFNVKLAYNAFVVGCKSDSIWDAIKSSCIMVGARTLSGALVPLVGPTPSGLSLVSGDYNRINGITGDGSTKYITMNSNPNTAPETLTHFAYAVYVTKIATVSDGAYIGCRGNSAPDVLQLHTTLSGTVDSFFSKNSVRISGAPPTPGFVGGSRAGNSVVLRAKSTTISGTLSTAANFSTQTNVGVFAFLEVNGNRVNYSNSTMAFYAQAGMLNLNTLEARVSGLMASISGAVS